MVQGGYYGLHDWLKLDEDYISKHIQDLHDYADFNGLDWDDPYDLLWTLLFYHNTARYPWQHPVIDPSAMNDLALNSQIVLHRLQTEDNNENINTDSLDLLIRFMYRSVAKVANRFSWARERFCLERADLIHQGILGIYPALEKWSINEKADFPYWAEQWIFASIQEMVTLQEPMVKIPHHLKILQTKLPKIREEAEQEFERHVSYEELAWYIRAHGYDRDIKKKEMMSGAEIAMLEVYNISSLNEVISEDELNYVELQDLIPDDGSNLLGGQTDLVKEVEYKDLIEALLDSLDEKQRFVVLNYQKGGFGDLKASEVAAELSELETREVVYTNAAITEMFESALIKMRFALYNLDLDEDQIFE